MRFKEYKNGGSIDPNYYTRLSEIESNNNSQARSKTSSASGKFQFIKSTWEGLTKKYNLSYNLEDRFDPEKSRKVAELYTQENANYLKNNLGITPNNTDLYAAHFMGVGGASKLLSTLRNNPNASAYEVATTAQINANKPIFLRKDGTVKTAKEVYDTLNYKVTKNSAPTQNTQEETQQNDPYRFSEYKKTDYYAPQVSENISSLDNTQETTNLAEDKATEIKNRLEQKKTEKALLQQMILATQVAYVNPADYQSQPTFEEPQEGQMFQRGGVSQFKKKPFQLQDERSNIATENTKVNNYNNSRLFNPNVRNKTDKEIAQEREVKIQTSVEAQKTPYTKENWRKQLAAETNATGDKLRVSNEPNFFDDYLNPAVMIGSMASNLGQAPLQAEQSDSVLPYVTSIGAPLTVGALAGLGTQTTGQFVNNLANPLAGTGDLVNNLGNKYLPNAYKLNPKAFKPSADKFYRQVDNTTYNEGLESGIIRGKQDVDMTQGEGIINLNRSFGDDAYYNKSSLYYKDNKDLPYLFEANLPEEMFIPKLNGRTRKLTTENTSVRVSKEPLSINDPNITTYKKDWLQGYKKMPTQQGDNTVLGLGKIGISDTDTFKSEINWSQWNKEIPDNPQLMQEYNAIEQTSKANKTWMKNPDGSKFQGTPEQFVQQNSENFKKAFPRGVDKTYRGSWSQKSYKGRLNEDNTKGAVFTGDEESIKKSYAPEKIFKSASEKYRRGLHELYYPKSENSFLLDAQNSNWRNIDKKLLPENVQDISSKSRVSTDDIAKYVEKNDIAYAKIKNVDDAGLIKEEIIFNHKPNNYLKSVWGNNGMFDMTNPNIYKSIVPIAGASYLATQQEEFKNGGEKNSLWKNIRANRGSGKKPTKEMLKQERKINRKEDGGAIPISSQGMYEYQNQEVIVPTNGSITMKNIPHDILGISQETGQQILMKPEKEYFFPNTQNVLEIPQTKSRIKTKRFSK
jgi:hypothetical protein